MGEQDGWTRLHLNRRDFLRYSLATGVVVWAGSQFPRGLGLDEAEAQALFDVKRVDPAVFPQSVASGDPQPKGIVLWTRLASLRSGTRVAYEIAPDARFRNPVLRGTVRTSAGKDNTVKVQLNNRREFKPFTTYYYRFIYDGNASRIGRFKTLPAATGRGLRATGSASVTSPARTTPTATTTPSTTWRGKMIWTSSSTLETTSTRPSSRRASRATVQRTGSSCSPTVATRR